MVDHMRFLSHALLILWRPMFHQVSLGIPAWVVLLSLTLPIDLRTDRLMQIVNIASRRVHARAKSKRLAASGAKSEGV